MRERWNAGGPPAKLLVAFVLLASLAAHAQPNSNCPESGVAYEVSLKDRASHTVHVAIHYKSPNSTVEFQLPVWNALYQVRDFSQYVSNVKVTDTADQTEVAVKIDKSSWRVDGDGECEVLTYDIFANNAGPFDAQLDDEHAFFNWAQLLMFPVGGKSAAMTVRLRDVPEGWLVRDGGIFGNYDPGKQPDHFVVAATYDALVDAPIEIGKFEQVDFSEDGGSYHIVIHAVPGDVKPQELSETIRKIVRAEVEWMHDRPFTDYTFIYHLPRGPARGGMEHANSTAIDVSAGRLADNPLAFASVTAHEFFHLWNVKRIRPQSLEPIDYTKEQYTRALWFSEGVTSTVSEWMLVRAGLLDEKGFLERLARQISELERRPAAKTQSVEESSLDAWLEKYPYYNTPSRSINYYNKGQIVGVLLDLEMREQSKGRKCLRDLFQYMNATYAKLGKYFADSEGVARSAEALTGGDFSPFVRDYIAGTVEIPYNQFFKSVGLTLVRQNRRMPDAGLSLARTMGKNTPTVSRVEPGGPADEVGIAPGDIIEEFNGKAPQDMLTQIGKMRTGDEIRLKVRSAAGVREVKLILAARESGEMVLSDLPSVSPAMRARRAAWIRGEAETPSEAGK